VDRIAATKLNALTPACLPRNVISAHSPVAAHRQGRIEQRGGKINPPAAVIR